MKTTVDIPDKLLADAMRFSRARTKREAVVVALDEFTRRRAMAELVRHAGTCSDLVDVDTVRGQRQGG